MTFKTDDILVITRYPLTLMKVIRVLKKTEEVCLSYISKELHHPIWLSNKMLKGYKKATKKDWYRAIRLHRIYKKLYPS